MAEGSYIEIYTTKPESSFRWVWAYYENGVAKVDGFSLTIIGARFAVWHWRSKRRRVKKRLLKDPRIKRVR